jgi:hypothetical protein
MHAKVHNFTCKRKRLMIQFGHDVIIYYIFGNLTYVATIFLKLWQRLDVCCLFMPCLLLLLLLLLLLILFLFFVSESEKFMYISTQNYCPSTAFIK